MLLFLDIDGTLTEPGSNVVPESAVEALRRAAENGHRLFLCTGRNRAMLSPLMKYGFEGAVASAGGYVFAGDKVLFDCPMDRETLTLAMELFRESGVFRTVEAKDGAWCDAGMGEFLVSRNGGNSELLRWRRALEEDLGMRPLAEYDGRPVYKIVFMCAHEKQLEGARQALEDRYHFVLQDAFSPNCVNGEMIDRHYDKGKGVRIVAEALGYAPEETVGFGDSMNDLEMIETVGTSVCMGNGSPLLKAKSDIVCPPVGQDGLAEAFRMLGLI